MTDSNVAQEGNAIDISVRYGEGSLQSILCTEELYLRPSRSPDYEKENRALVALARALAGSPRTILQLLADTILEVCQADSAGISLLTTRDGGKWFYWPAIAGRWKPQIGGGTPRGFSPCGDVLDRNTPVLMRHIEQRYTYFQTVTPPVEECLLVPFCVEGKAIGTIWAVAHDDRRKFDVEDERVMRSLGNFASSAYQILASLDALQLQAIERQKAEDATHESERRLEDILEALPAAVYTTDTEGRITMFNHAAVEFSGRVPELGSDSWCVSWKMYSPDGTPLPHDQCPMAIALKENRSIRGAEAIAERPDGTRIAFVPYPTPLYDDSGKLRGAVNMLVDISERKNVEEKLRESEEQFRALFEQTSAGIAQTDLTGRFLLVNDRYCEIVGRSREQLMDLHMQDLTHPEDLPSNAAQFAALAKEGGPNFAVEKRYVRPDGSDVWVQNHVSVIHDAQGKIHRIAAAVTDITERKRGEELRSRLAAIVESSDDAIISKDLNGIIRSWNSGAERLFGYTAREAIGQSVTILIPPDHADEEPSILARICRGERIEHYETIRRHKAGTLLDVSLTVSPIVNERSRIVGASKIARDITERKRIEQERHEFEKREQALTLGTKLREMEAELARVTRALTVGELATSIAHEVNQPLAAIVTNAEAGLRWLAGQTPNLYEVRESLAFIVRDGNRAGEVIRRIREFLKKDSYQRALLEINEVIQEAVALANAEILKSQVTLRVELSAELPPVWADRIQLQQVILNLIMNARDAMASIADRQRELAVISRKSGGYGVLVAVRDSGPGINQQDLDRMFDAFFTTKPMGMGMGLSICRSIIEAHGGRIWARPNDSSGLTVQFQLPAESENPS